MSEAPKDGLHVEHYENGQKAAEGHYKNGKEHGLITEWYENGQKRSERQMQAGKLVSTSVWQPNGEPCPITKIVDGSGICVAWHENGQKAAEGHFKDGKQDGLVAEWHENGQKMAEGHFKNGEEDGLSTAWHENGQKKVESHFKNGKQDGLGTFWYENGQKESEGNYIQGEPDGKWTCWHENGQKAGEANLRQGEPDGPVTHWNEKGQLVEPESQENELAEYKPEIYFLRIALVGIIFGACIFTGIGVHPLLFMLVLSLAIGVHELGHFFAAKMCGIPVNTFRIGLGPRLIRFRWSEVNWELGSIPVLGYVAINEFPQPASDSYRDRIWAKLKTLFFFSGGVAVNFLIAVAIFWSQNPQDGAANAGIQTSKAVGHLYLIIPEATWDMIRPKNIIKDQKGIIREFASDQKDASTEEKRENYIQMLWILNVVLVAFNLFPFPGLDGFRLLTTGIGCFFPGDLPERVKKAMAYISIVFILGISTVGAFWMIRDIFMLLVDQPPENGQHVEYYESGEKRLETHYRNGKKQGRETTWYENGRKAVEGNLKNGLANGLATWWHENGQRKVEVHYKDGKRDGLGMAWHENGQKKREGRYKNGEPDGLETTWYENGQKAVEHHWRNGLANGPFTQWYENGQIRTEQQFKEGELISALSRQPNGDPCPYTKVVNGSGVFVKWQGNGKKSSTRHFKNGKKDGLWQFWHENGQKWWEMNYKNDKLDGLWTRWYENGKKEYEIQYKDGVEVSRKEF